MVTSRMVSGIFKPRHLSWWGKLFGGTFGYLLGGPLGGLIGVALGHNLEKGVKVARRHIAPGFGPGEKERIQAAFFTATFSVMGHLARSDGKITNREIALAKKVMTQMKLSLEQKKAAGRLFNEGKRPDFPFDAVLDQFKSECKRRRSLLRMFIEVQLHAAYADGVLSFQKKKLLIQIANCFEFSKQEFEQLSALIRSQQHQKRSTRSSPRQTHQRRQDSYDILGVTPKDSYDDIKKAYRRLISQHHPDKLVAKGLPEEMMKLATEKIQEIKAAYDQIKKDRKF